MRFIKRFANYLVLFLLLIGLIGLFFLTLELDQKVAFADPNVEAAIREVLEQPAKPLHVSEVSKITELDLSGRGITTLAGIETLSNLTDLNLENNEVQDVSPLAPLRKLRKLNLSNNGLTDLEKANFASLGHLSLTELNLDYNVVMLPDGEPIWLNDISVLANFRTLKHLTLTENKISDISSLAALVNLKTLDVENNRIQDISAVRSIKQLKTLNLGFNDVKDLTPLRDQVQLTHLFLHANKNIETVLPLENLNQLKTLTLDGVRVGDQASVLANKLDLVELSMADSQLTDITALQNLRHLQALTLRDNGIADLSPLAGLRELRELDLQSNPTAAGVDALGDLTKLEKLDIQDVPVGENVAALANLKQLTFLDARNCGITDTTALGSIMALGALQDNQKTGAIATVDLRDNPISVSDEDDYSPIRAYWNNIQDRTPFLLPEYAPLPSPTFSTPGGYYNAPFNLVLSTSLDNAEIYYTLDGSEPTRDSLRYQEPLMIKSRAGEPNNISLISDISPRYEPPIGEVFKATVIRARVIDENGRQSPIVTSTFLVDEQKQYTLPIISIVTDPDYLIDYEEGIYVMGRIFDQLYDPALDIRLWERDANYMQRGQAWERPIHIEYIQVDGVVGLSQDASMRIHGAGSRERPEKTLRIYSRCQNPCPETFQYELLPGLTRTATGEPLQEFKTFLLRNSGNDWEQTMFRDALAQSLLEHTNLDVQAYSPTIVFLNGEYWGIHNLRERLDEYYLENHYGIAPEEVVILSGYGTLETGVAGDEQHYRDMVDFIKTHDMADAENYAYIKTQMDVDNFIDYQILNIYVNNHDWPENNVKYWRKRTAGFEQNASYGQDGRWRWLLFDTDYAFGLKEGTKATANNNLERAINPTWHSTAGLLLRSLLENPEFKANFLRRFADHLNTAFSPQHVMSKIDQMQAALDPEMEDHIRRWPWNGNTYDGWKFNVDVLRDFAMTRPHFVKEHITNYFELPGTFEIHIETDRGMGYLQINTVDITADTPGVNDPANWTGIYFQGQPVKITAVPYPGYKFVKWEAASSNNLQLDQRSITVEKDTSLRAIFSKE